MVNPSHGMVNMSMVNPTFGEVELALFIVYKNGSHKVNQENKI